MLLYEKEKDQTCKKDIDTDIDNDNDGEEQK